MARRQQQILTEWTTEMWIVFDNADSRIDEDGQERGKHKRLTKVKQD